MRTKFLFLVILNLIIIKSKAELTYLIGQVPNFNTLDQQIYMGKSISVSYFNLIWVEEIESVLIQKNGEFKIVFDLPFAQDIYIQSGTGAYIVSLTHPGDTIQLNLEYQLTNQKYEGLPSPFYRPVFESSFVSNSKAKQERFFNFFYKWIIEKRIANQIMSENKGIKNQLAAIEFKLNSYFLNNEADSDLFKWGINNLFYSILYQSIGNGDSIDLKNLKYPSNHGIFSREFYNALNRIKYINEQDFYKNKHVTINGKISDAILSNSFIVLSEREKQFVKSMNPETNLSKNDSIILSKFSRKLNASQKYSDFRDSLMFHSESNYMINHLPQYISDCLIAQNIAEKSSDKLNCALIVDESIKDYVIQKLENIKKSDSKIEDYIFPANSLITGLIEKNKGKSMYVDIWATWCGPCRNELPNYPELIKHSGDKVKFVFLCVQSPEKLYLEVINELKFKAEHYFLSAKQYEELSVNYKVTGFPHYLFITSEGKVINKTFRPSNKKELFELFDKD